MNNFKINNSYLYLLLGFVCLFFFNGRWILPSAAFIAPIFLIRFLRLQKPFKGFIFILIAGWVSNIFVWKEMIPMGGFIYYIVMFMMSLFTSVSFLIDRVYSQKIKGIISTLVFPSAFVVIEYISVYTNPGGSNGALPHTQSSLPFLQIVSLTGIWGISFLIMWTASVINWLWDNSFERKNILSALLVYGVPVLLVILYGEIRLSTNIETKTVRVASINISKTSYYNKNHAFDKYFENKSWSEYDIVSDKINNEFLNQCEIAASSGAKIVFGIETVISLKKVKEEVFIEKAKAIAKKDSIYLGLPTQVILEGFPGVLPENKIIWISPDGQLLFTYHKSKPTPGEASYGDGALKYFDSPYGRISTAICFDMDFPGLINQLSNKNIDIMLVPGNDWSVITPYHTYVSSFRALELGFNMVRAASKGLSASFNYKGQLISSMDYFRTNELVLYSDIPVKGQKTVYSMLGDYFAWLCILFFALMSGIIITTNKRKS